MTDASELQAKIIELERELADQQALSAHLAKQNDEIMEIVKSYLDVISKIFPEREVVLPD